MIDARDLPFEWEDAKAASNVAKHGLTFEAGSDVFFDPDCIIIDASRTSDRELRRKALGTVDGHLLAVVHTMRGDTVRLISVRRAGPKELQHGRGAIQT